MTTYLISPADESDRMAVRSFSDRAQALKQASRSDHVVERPADVRWSGSVLAEVYNACGGSFKKHQFETWDSGVERFFDLLARVARRA
jgi:hypothetical protein